jgi:hypothetical protein
MRPKQGRGAAGARPLSRHTTRVPSRVGRGGSGFLGVKIFPGGSLFTLPCPHLPRAPHRFFPVCPYFLPPGSPYINFPPKFSLFTPIFSIYIKFSPGEALFTAWPEGGVRPADPAPLSAPSGRS